MLKKYPLLFSSFLLATSLHLHGQQDEMDTGFGKKERVTTPYENTVSPMGQTQIPFTGAICGSKVRMRASPSLEGHVVRETAHGEMFVVAGETHDYYAVVPPKDTKGYVFRTFILDGCVEGERVNVRLFPDTDAPVIGQLNTGHRVDATVCEANNKWLEISLPDTSRFFIAKEYIEHKGPVELYAAIEKKKSEATYRLSAASLFAQSEIQKPFEQIDLDRIREKFEQISEDYSELPIITAQVRDAISLIQDIYVEKKIAFLEGKTNFRYVASDPDSAFYAKNDKNVSDIASAASKTMGLASTLGSTEITDKMLVWQPLEESLYHLWMATHGENDMDAFYAEEEQEATLLTGIVEPYNRPVKNRPGDFLLRDESMPVAFLYSTRINLEKWVGQKITLLATPRPNHNFAFPAYFVISVE